MSPLRITVENGRYPDDWKIDGGFEQVGDEFILISGRASWLGVDVKAKQGQKGGSVRVKLGRQQTVHMISGDKSYSFFQPSRRVSIYIKPVEIED